MHMPGTVSNSRACLKRAGLSAGYSGTTPHKRDNREVEELFGAGMVIITCDFRCQQLDVRM